MAFYDQARAWYFHDLWKRTLSTWGTGQSWTRVDLSRPGPTFDYPDFAASQTEANLSTLAAHGQSGIARRFRWNGSTWVLEAHRATGDTGALDPARANAQAQAAPTQRDYEAAAAAWREKREQEELIKDGAIVALGFAVLMGWL